MYIITLAVVSVLVGWLSTLILLSDLDNLSLLDGVGVTGTALAGGLSAPLFVAPRQPGVRLGAVRNVHIVARRHEPVGSRQTWRDTVISYAHAGDLRVIVSKAMQV